MNDIMDPIRPIAPPPVTSAAAVRNATASGPADGYAGSAEASAPVRIQPAAEEVRNTGRATVVEPSMASGGALRKYSVIHPEDVVVATVDGEPRTFFVSDTGNCLAVNCVGPNGRLRFQQTLPYRSLEVRMQAAPALDRLYFHSQAGLCAAELSSGRPCGWRDGDFDAKHLKAPLAVGPDGTVAYRSGLDVVTCDRNLNVNGHHDAPFKYDKVSALDNGAVAAVECNVPTRVAVFDRSGQLKLRVDKGEDDSVRTDARGRLCVLEGDDFVSKEIVQFDPATGQSSRFDITAHARNAVASFPLLNGSYLVYDCELCDCKLMMFSPYGELQHTFDTGQDVGAVRQMLIRRDNTAAYVVMERDRNKEFVLYRLPLDAPAPPPSAIGRPAPGRKPAELVTTWTSDKTFPAILQDGRIALFHADRTELLRADGSCEQTFRSLAAVCSTLVPSTEVVADRFRMGIGSESNLTGSWPAVLEHAAALFSPEQKGQFVAAPGTAEYCSNEKALQFKENADIGAILEGFGVRDRAQLDALLQADMERVLATTTVHKVGQALSVPFPGDANTLVEMEPRKLTARHRVHNTKAPQKVLELPWGRFTTVLPVRIADRCFIAAGTDEGDVHWMKADSPETDSIYRLGSPVAGLAVLDGRAVCALGQDGKVLLIETPLPAGVTIESPRPEAPQAADEVHVHEDEVQLGSLILPRQR